MTILIPSIKNKVEKVTENWLKVIKISSKINFQENNKKDKYLLTLRRYDRLQKRKFLSDWRALPIIKETKKTP